MVVRACKAILRRRLASSPMTKVIEIFVAFLNNLFAVNNSKKAENLKHDILDEVLLRFRYTLSLNQYDDCRNMSLLRELCQRTGVQLKKRPFLVDNHRLFTVDDVYDIYPIIHSAAPKTGLGDEIFESGITSLRKGQKNALELVLEAGTIQEQIFGQLHPATSRIIARIATTIFQLGDAKIALNYLRRATIIRERILGLDYHETIAGYVNLGYWELSSGNSTSALEYFRRVVDLRELVYGPDHPDTFETDIMIMFALQNVKDTGRGVIFGERACRLVEQLFGTKSIQYARVSQHLARAFAVHDDFKSAIQYQKATLANFTDILGKDDSVTKEADSFLQILTTNAVVKAKQLALDLQKMNGTSSKIRNGGRRSPNSGNLVTSANQIDSSLSHLPVDKLVEYIESSSKRRHGKTITGTRSAKIQK